MRRGPSTNDSKILLLTKGERLEVLGEESLQPQGELFIKVRTSMGYTGYVVKRFIK